MFTMPPGDIYKYRVRISLLKQEELLPAENGAKNKEVVFKNDQNPLNDIGESGKTKIVANTASFGFKRKQSSVRRRKDPAGALMKGSPFTQRKELRKADESKRESEVKETWLDVDVEKHEEKDLLPGETYKVSLALTPDTQTVLKKGRSPPKKTVLFGTLSQTLGTWGSKVSNFLVKIKTRLF